MSDFKQRKILIRQKELSPDEEREMTKSEFLEKYFKNIFSMKYLNALPNRVHGLL